MPRQFARSEVQLARSKTTLYLIADCVLKSLVQWHLYRFGKNSLVLRVAWLQHLVESSAVTDVYRMTNTAPKVPVATGGLSPPYGFIVYRNLVIASIRTNRTLLLHVGNIETDDNRSPRIADDLVRLEAEKRLQKWYEHVILF